MKPKPTKDEVRARMAYLDDQGRRILATRIPIMDDHRDDASDQGKLNSALDQLEKEDRLEQLAAELDYTFAVLNQTEGPNQP